MKKFLELINSYSGKALLKAGLAEIKRKIWREAIRGSYSQDYEDLKIEKYLSQKKGRYLEIGAYHPKRLSNSYRFYKKGWRGVVVEPNPEVKKLFLEIRPGDKFIGEGVGQRGGYLYYHQFLIPALNTFDGTEARRRRAEGHKEIEINKIKVKAIEKIARGKIDFLSIDCEGMDYLILKAWPWQRVKPKLICVEKENRNRIEKLLEKKGYQKKEESKFNLIFLWQKSTPGDGHKL